MTVTNEIRILGRDGILQDILVGAAGNRLLPGNSGYLSLSYTKEVNGVGSGMFVINSESKTVNFLDPQGATLLDAQIEFWRYDIENEIEPYCDFYGFLRDREYMTDDNGTTTFIAYLEEQQDYLRRSIIAYNAGVSGRTLFSATAAETVLKALVTYNATTSGTTGDGRALNVPTWGSYITVDADGAEGDSVTVSCAGRNLFDVLREVADLGGLDFGLTKSGAQAWDFWVDTRMGDDHSEDVVFSLPYGNMRRPRLRSNRRAEKTVAVVGGQSASGVSTKVVRTGTNYNAIYNAYEVFVNGSQYDTTTGLESTGDDRLEELRAIEELMFDVIQVPSTLYGKHYRLGDTVGAYYLGFSYTPKIMRVNVDVRERGNQPPEQIEVTLADI